MSDNMVTRQEKIDFLIDYDLATNAYEKIELLANGFKGYNNMTDDEINTCVEQAQ